MKLRLALGGIDDSIQPPPATLKVDVNFNPLFYSIFCATNKLLGAKDPAVFITVQKDARATIRSTIVMQGQKLQNEHFAYGLDVQAGYDCSVIDGEIHPESVIKQKLSFSAHRCGAYNRKTLTERLRLGLEWNNLGYLSHSVGQCTHEYGAPLPAIASRRKPIIVTINGDCGATYGIDPIFKIASTYNSDIKPNRDPKLFVKMIPDAGMAYVVKMLLPAAVAFATDGYKRK